MRARQGYVILAGLLAAIGPVTRFAQAQNWSPGGRWVAYSLAESPAQAWPGWVFGSEEPAGNQKADPTVYRVWTTEVETGDSVLLYESLEPTTQPGWKLDGTALAYGRVRTEKAGAKRLELIVQNAPDRFQVVESAPLGGMADLRRLVDLPVLWSPEGRFLVVPRLEPEGLAVVKVENGSVAFNLNGASRASWSPDGARLVYFRQANPPVVEVLDVRSGEKTVLADAPNSDLFPTPCWSPDGESVLFVSWSREEEKAGEPKSRAEGLSLTLERRDVVEGRRELATELSHPPITHVKELRAIRLGLDVEGAQVFYAVAIEGKDVGIHWVYLKRQEVRKFFNPYENSRPVVNLGVCPLPNSTQLVLRFGPLDRPSPPALCDASTEELRALVPDDETRAAWILSIFSTMGQALKTSEVMLGEVEPMPTRLPMPGDIDPSHPAFFRLRELARQGRPLCDRPSDSGPASPELTSLLDEARLVFSYLLGDYSQALAAVEAREEKAGSRDERLRLLGLRAQIHIGMGETDRARAIVEHLRKQMSNGSVRVEETGSGLALVTLPDAAEAWPEMLAIRLDALTNGQGKEGDLATTDDPILDHVNPDAPQPGLGLDPVPVVPPPPIPPGMPIPAQPPAFQIRRLPDQPRAILERRQGPPGSVRVRIVPANPNR